MGGLGGPVKRLATLLSHLDGIQRVLLKPASPALDNRLRAAGAIDEHITLRLSAQRSWVGAAAISMKTFQRCLSRRHPVDVVHANGLVEFALCWPAAVLLRKPIVTWVGNYEPPEMVKRFAALLRPVARRTKWNAVSSVAANTIADCGLVPADAVRITPNIVDPRDVIGTNADAIRQRSASQNEPHGLTVGYLQVARWEKGFDLLVPIIEELKDLEGRITFLLFVRENEHPAWKSLRGFGDDLVQVRDRSAQVADVYAQCDVVLSPSRRESFNRVAAEALTAGVPLVASDLEAVREVVGHAALLFPVEDPVGAAAQIRRLVDDPSLRAQLAEAGRHRSVRWDPRPVSRYFAQTYASLSEDRGTMQPDSRDPDSEP